jgi:ABC-type transporter Mla maintaining outer membrane lipid asymmetry permease subunit MlaE
VLGPALAAIFMEIDLGSYYDAILNSLRLPEMLVSLAKTTTFGVVIAAVACTCGLHVPMLRTWVPQAAEMAVMRGLTLLLVADVLFGLLLL